MKKSDQEAIKDIGNYLEHFASIDKKYTPEQHTEAKKGIMKSIGKHAKLKPTYQEQWNMYTCNPCGLSLARQFNYCPHCGQRLEWKE